MLEQLAANHTVLSCLFACYHIMHTCTWSNHLNNRILSKLKIHFMMKDHFEQEHVNKKKSYMPSFLYTAEHWAPVMTRRYEDDWNAVWIDWWRVRDDVLPNCCTAMPETTSDFIICISLVKTFTYLEFHQKLTIYWCISSQLSMKLRFFCIKYLLWQEFHLSQYLNKYLKIEHE